MARASAPEWYALPHEQVLVLLGTSESGLASQEAAARLQRWGPNTVEVDRGVNPWLVLLHQFTSPLIYILIAAMVVTISIRHWADAIVIGLIVALNAIVGFAEEYRAENAVRALLAFVTPTATVLRDGREHEVESRTLVPGDIALISSGDLVPADLRLLRAVSLLVDEAPLTGESTPVSKRREAPLSDGTIPLGDQRDMAFMGTTVSSGRGMGVVVATGSRTQVGSIATQIRHVARGVTPLQGRMAQFGRWIGIAVLSASAVIFALGWLQHVPPVDMFLSAVAIAVSAIPEGLPVVVTIAMAIGVRRMARRNAIIRRLAAVETLGSCTVIVSDKTGTLTENQMTVQAILAGGKRYAVTGPGRSLDGTITLDGEPVTMEESFPLRLTLEAGMLTNEASLHVHDHTFVARGDPTEVALLVAGAKAGLARDVLLARYPVVVEVPFEPERRFSASIHRDEEREIAFVKGAPERVIAMCDTMLTPDGHRPLDSPLVLKDVHTMAGEGLRVLAMAVGVGREATERTVAGDPGSLAFIGLVGMLDPPRAEVVDAVANCRQAGIRILMVTGDHEATAAAIAQRIGLSTDLPEVCTGTDLEGMSDEKLGEALQEIPVYSRVSPAQKLRIVNALRKQGEVVAVTGDGVNDAPALKSAHIGVAMGRTGTDVAKEASDIVLADDNFATIYAAVEEGRTAFANIRNTTFFLVSSGVGELIAIVTSLALGMPLPYLPAQILWLNLVTNGVQDVALAFEPGEREQYLKPPRDPGEGILSRLLLERTLIVGVVLASGTLGLFAWELERGMSLGYAQVTALTTMVMFQIFHVGNCRSETRSVFRKSPFSNRFLFLGTAASIAIHVGATHFGPSQALLRLEPLHLETWLRMAVVASSVVLVVEMHKILRRPSA